MYLLQNFILITNGEVKNRYAFQVIQHLPWESIPVLVDHSVTRMPSVHFLFAHWKSLSDDPTSVVNVGVNRRSVFYIVNPDNDLLNTQKTFESWFTRFAPTNFSFIFLTCSTVAVHYWCTSQVENIQLNFQYCTNVNSLFSSLDGRLNHVTVRMCMC